MESIITRIRKVGRDIGQGEGKFEKAIGVSIGYLNISEKRNTDPGASILLNIVNNYPEYSLQWLLTGEGSMVLTEVDRVAESRAVYGKDTQTIDALVRKIAKEVIVEDVQPKIELLNDNINRYLQLNMDVSRPRKNKKSSS